MFPISLQKDPTNRIGKVFKTRCGISVKLIAYNSNRPSYPYLAEVLTDDYIKGCNFRYMSSLRFMSNHINNDMDIIHQTIEAIA
jgi:hypothetical protein